MPDGGNLSRIFGTFDGVLEDSLDGNPVPEFIDEGRLDEFAEGAKLGTFSSALFIRGDKEREEDQ